MTIHVTDKEGFFIMLIEGTLPRCWAIQPRPVVCCVDMDEVKGISQERELRLRVARGERLDALVGGKVCILWLRAEQGRGVATSSCFLQVFLDMLVDCIGIVGEQGVCVVPCWAEGNRGQKLGHQGVCRGREARLLKFFRLGRVGAQDSVVPGRPVFTIYIKQSCGAVQCIPFDQEVYDGRFVWVWAPVP